MDFSEVKKAFENNGYTVSHFAAGDEAAEYINSRLDGEVIGFGDSKTMIAMGLYDRLSSHNTVYDPNQGKDNDEFHELAKKALITDVFLTSVNAVSATGEMVNIDGTGNRVAGSLFGHKKVIFVVSTNKIEPDLEKAVWRARNIASPMNAAKYDLNTPCVKNGGRCTDCSSPERICNAMVIYMKRMGYLEDSEIVFIDEKLGF